MKITLELPDGLVKAVKLRALHDGRKFKDTVADLLRAGLAGPLDLETRAVIRYDETTDLPAVQCILGKPPGLGLTPEQIKDLLLEQEAEWALNVR